MILSPKKHQLQGALLPDPHQGTLPHGPQFCLVPLKIYPCAADV